MSPQGTHSRLETYLRRVKRHPAILIITALVGLVIGAGALLNSFDTIGKFFHEHAEYTRGLPARPSERAADVSKGNAKVEVQAAAPPLAASSTAEGSATLSGISAKDVFETLRDKSLTDLQRSQFVQRTRGEVVQWVGFVRSVERGPGGAQDSPILVVFVPSFASDELFPALVVASFPSSSEADLSALSTGDKVTIMGHLDYLEFGKSEPALDKCKLITFVKKVK